MKEKWPKPPSKKTFLVPYFLTIALPIKLPMAAPAYKTPMVIYP